MMPWTHAKAWAWAALISYVLVVVAVLLLPISPQRIVEVVAAWLRRDMAFAFVRTGWVEFAANVLLFAPVGFLVTVVAGRVWAGLAATVLLSLAAELAQVFLPSRASSPRDLLANALGGLIGVALAWLIQRGRRDSTPSPTGPRA